MGTGGSTSKAGAAPSAAATTGGSAAGGSRGVAASGARHGSGSSSTGRPGSGGRPSSSSGSGSGSRRPHRTLGSGGGVSPTNRSSGGGASPTNRSGGGGASPTSRSGGASSGSAAAAANSAAAAAAAATAAAAASPGGRGGAGSGGGDSPWARAAAGMRGEVIAIKSDGKVRSAAGDAALAIRRVPGAAEAVAATYRWTSLHEAAMRGSLKEVRDRVEVGGEDVNAKDKYGRVVMAAAAGTGQLHVVRYLTERCPQLTVVYPGERTPLHWAAARGHWPVVQHLVDACGCSPSPRTILGYTPLFQAVEADHASVVEFFATRHPATFTTPLEGRATLLHIACQEGAMRVAQYLTQHMRQSVEARDANGATPLHLATARQHARLLRFLLRTYPQPPPMLTDLLHHAALNGAVSTAAAVLEVPGAVVDAPANDGSGRTALFIAACEGHTRLVRYLLETEGASTSVAVDSAPPRHVLLALLAKLAAGVAPAAPATVSVAAATAVAAPPPPPPLPVLRYLLSLPWPPGLLTTANLATLGTAFAVAPGDVYGAVLRPGVQHNAWRRRAQAVFLFSARGGAAAAAAAAAGAAPAGTAATVAAGGGARDGAGSGGSVAEVADNARSDGDEVGGGAAGGDSSALPASPVHPPGVAALAVTPPLPGDAAPSLPVAGTPPPPPLPPPSPPSLAPACDATDAHTPAADAVPQAAS